MKITAPNHPIAVAWRDGSYDLREAAEQLGACPRTLRRMVYGRIPADAITTCQLCATLGLSTAEWLDWIATAKAGPRTDPSMMIAEAASGQGLTARTIAALSGVPIATVRRRLKHRHGRRRRPAREHLLAAVLDYLELDFFDVAEWSWSR